MQSKKVLLSAVSIVLLSAVLGLADQPGKTLERGKTGKVTFHSQVRIGNTLLEPGGYLFQHVVTVDEHAMVFTKTTTTGGPGPGREVARVRCTLQLLGEKAKDTAVHMYTSGGEETIRMIHIRGETVTHLF